MSAPVPAARPNTSPRKEAVQQARPISCYCLVASSRIFACGVPNEGGGIDTGGPDVRLEEAEEAFCLACGIEVEVNDDIVQVADGPLDALLAYPGLPPGLGEAPERGVPGFEIGHSCWTRSAPHRPVS